MNKLSTVIMTFNEEEKIERCIRSVLDISDEVLVLDSYSNDKTVDIARSLGARIEFHPFEGYIKQRERSVLLASNSWVLALDADEFLSPGLAEEIKGILDSPGAKAFYLNRLNAINHYFLKHGSWFPHRIIRLFRKDSIYCSGNPPHDRIYAREGVRTQKLKGLLLHHCNENIEDRIDTINRHSSIAAQHRFDSGKKTHFFRIWLKPPWKFIVEYILRLGFLDGFYGYVMAKTTAHYIFYRESKLKELWRNQKTKVDENKESGR